MSLPRVVFVDDDASVLAGLRRQLYDRRRDWDMAFAGSGAEALDLLSAGPARVLVSDMRMPGMDGAELFEHVRGLWPDTVRILLTGYTDREQNLRSARSAHQFLNKPCDPAQLRQSLDEALELGRLVEAPALRAQLAKLVSLPLQGQIQQHIRDEMDKADASLKRLGAWVEQDAGLSAKLLQFVNSAALALPQRILRPAQAVALLGLDQVRQFWLALEAHKRVQPSHREDHEHAFSHGQAVAMAVRHELAPLGEEAAVLGFSAGLMHDIGALALEACLPEAWEQCRGRGLAAEQAACGADHSQVGAFLLGLWGLPRAVVQAVAEHHNLPDPAQPLQAALVRAEAKFDSTVDGRLAPAAA